MVAAVNICLRVAAFLTAVALIASQVIQNLEHLGWSSLYTGLGLAAIAVPIAMALAVPVMGHSWTERQYVTAMMALVVVLAGVCHTTIVAWERVAHSRDTLSAAKSGTNYQIEMATTAHDNALARVRELEAAEAQPCRRVGKTGLPTSECAAAREQTALARQRVGDTQSALVTLGPPVEAQGMASRYGTLASVIDTVHPVLLPIAVELGALVLIGFSFRRGREEPKRPAKAVSPAVREPEVAAPAQTPRLEGPAALAEALLRKPEERDDTTPTAPKTGTIASFRMKRAA